jgi:hypothetical protein
MCLQSRNHGIKATCKGSFILKLLAERIGQFFAWKQDGTEQFCKEDPLVK